MFTGIVEEVGRIVAIGEGGLIVEADVTLGETRIGDSLSVNGACLTVTEMTDSRVSFDVMPETLRRTAMNVLKPGSPINLERAVTFNSRLGGHLVQGHVDGTGTVAEITPEADARLVRIAAPPDVMKYVVEKAFIAVNGISLTVMGLDEESFTVSLVRHTYENTDLGEAYVGMPVNLETDIFAKYAEKLLQGDREGIDALSEGVEAG
ncbi:MAG: riboflavin synthase [Dehalococcoidia bacterium]|nr:riboflavin synthase [Dehalococcoidia bacterium]